MKLILNGKQLDTKNLSSIGIGGEAEVFLTPTHTALKVFKGKNHPDYQGNVHAQKGAEDRILAHQKKLAAFPKGLPASIVGPMRLAYDMKNQVCGYEMKFLPNLERIWSYAQPTILSANVTGSMLLELFRNMHASVLGLHTKQVIIGDFNDLNVLVQDHTKPWFIDADSYQYGGFDCMTFDERFVDPKKCILAQPDTHPDLCPDGRSHMMLAQRHSTESDWYAFAVMLMQSLLLVGPYGGVYRPKQHSVQVAHHLRPMSRITVFHPDVIYPKKARSFKILPDDLLHHFANIFEKDVRELFPLSLLQNMRFTTCTQCGTMHARMQCPTCSAVSKDHMVTSVMRGNVTAEKIFTTSGTLLRIAMESDGLKILYYENGTYLREGKRIVKTAPLANMKYRICGNKTFMASSDELISISAHGNVETIAVDVAQNIPTFDTNSEHVVWCQGGKLYRDREILGRFTPDVIADVLAGQTMIWSGDHYGFGFYRAGELQRFFVFDPNKSRGILDSIPIPPIRGQMIDAACTFSSKAIWFFVSTVEGSERKNRAYQISPDGKLLGQAEALVDDDSWLGTIRGNVAAGTALFAATDEGIVRVENAGGTLYAAKSFPDTAEFVDSSSELFLGNGCLIARRGKTIWKLTIK